MRRITCIALGGTAAVALTLGLAQTAASAGNPASAAKLPAIGLTTDGSLLAFGFAARDGLTTIGSVSGLAGDTSLIGIDFRVQDGQLYGVGDAGGVYTVSTRTAAATKVGQLSVPLAGTAFDIDFNPAADRLRLLSNTGQNLRHDLNSGTTTTDGTLTYPPLTTAVTGVTAGAYTNNDLDTDTATTLIDLDTSLDQVALQSPANSGQLAATGKLGVDAVGDAGFDIYSKLRDGQTISTTGYATLTVGERSAVYSVSLLSGTVTKLRTFPSTTTVTDLAVRLAK